MADMPDESLAGKRDQSYVPWYKRCIPSWRMVAIGVLLLCATPVANRWYRLSQLPDVPVPFDVEAFCEVPESLDENAFHYFNQAACLPHDVRLPDELDIRWGKGLAWTDLPATLQSAVIQNGPAIDLYRQGGRCPTASYVPPQNYTVATLLPTVQEVRGLQRSSNLEVLRLLHEGEHEAAVELLHDTYRATRHLGRRGVLIERLVGIACHAIHVPGWHEWSRQEQVSAEQLETALARIREDWKLTPPFSDNLIAEYFVIANEAKPPMTFLKSEFDRDIDQVVVTRLKLSTRPAAATLNGLVPGWQIPLMWTLGEPELTARGAKLFVQHQLKYCDLPFAEQPPMVKGGVRLYDGPEQTAGLSPAALNERLSQTLLSSFNLGSFALDFARREAARQILLETELELQIRFRRAGADSRLTIEHAVAGYAWPVDPCDPRGQSLLYRSDDAGLTIWSRGTNGKDNQGKGSDAGEDDYAVIIPWPGSSPVSALTAPAGQ